MVAKGFRLFARDIGEEEAPRLVGLPLVEKPACVERDEDEQHLSLVFRTSQLAFGETLGNASVLQGSPAGAHCGPLPFR